MRTGIIYRATSPSGKVYIGQTIKDLRTRKSYHHWSARNNPLTTNTKFSRAIKKYGIDGLCWEVLHQNIPLSQLDYLECLEIIYYDSYSNGYNSTQGGSSIERYTPETLGALSKGRIGKKHSDETRLKISNATRGRRHTPEELQKISMGNILAWKSSFRKKSPAPSETTKKKLQRSSKQYWNTRTKEELRQHGLRATLYKHRPLKEEEKKNISEKLREFYSNHPSPRLQISDEQVIEIRRLSLEGITVRNIATIFNVAVATIKGIAGGHQRRKVKELLEEIDKRTKERKTRKLTPDDILNIRRLAIEGKKQSELASMYSVKQGHISRIINKIRWSSINE